MNYPVRLGGPDGVAVAANGQPRVTGQWLIGSSRQEGSSDPAIDRPCARGSAIRDRAGAGVGGHARDSRLDRHAAGDARRSPVDRRASVAPRRLVGAGHEGLGITTCFATARLLADQILARRAKSISRRTIRRALPVIPGSTMRTEAAVQNVTVHIDGVAVGVTTAPASPLRLRSPASCARGARFPVRRALPFGGMGMCQECRVTIDAWRTGSRARCCAATACRS